MHIYICVYVHTHIHTQHTHTHTQCHTHTHTHSHTHTLAVPLVETRSNQYTLIMYRSVSLLLQVSLPCLHFAAGPTECHLIGGTNTDLAPPIDYIEKVMELDSTYR